MSIEMAPERVCYVHCNFCNTVLVVSVPSSSLCTIVTVRCGHCGNLLSVNMAGGLQSPPLPDTAQQLSSENMARGSGSSSSSNNNTSSRFSSFEPVEPEPPRMTPVRPPEKRQRVPSAYNRFIKEEIQRIKASNPDISHREAFSTAAKNWAHFPHIHFGLKLDGNKQGKVDQAIAGDHQGTHKSHGFY
ncbi:hypothetical protein BT93_J0389 [Corymbia citriodora subsp. variegata]|nr:hypothetical protein BT93_J0389 [Corymbia citriodora subsp. variegata]KAF8009378.1 hypothetical protein BT93_J0389 [Corymbia citriodora subsp. variegata]KAF8009380.1 hypothetical protein BT93_J0389 [Corymbia citriodora subsp. variegata]